MRGTLPERVRTRRDKLGFATPEEFWVRQAAPDRFRRALHQAVEASQDTVDGRVSSILDEYISGKRPFDFLIWRAISFGAWMRIFGVSV